MRKHFRILSVLVLLAVSYFIVRAHWRFEMAAFCGKYTFDPNTAPDDVILKLANHDMTPTLEDWTELVVLWNNYGGGPKTALLADLHVLVNKNKNLKDLAPNYIKQTIWIEVENDGYRCCESVYGFAANGQKHLEQRRDAWLENKSHEKNKKGGSPPF
jgi:hypothetical protein